MVRLCGAALGSFAFAITVFFGLHVGNPIEVTLWRALQAMVLFFVFGLCIGWVAYRILDEHALRRYRQLLGELEESRQEPTEPGEAHAHGSVEASLRPVGRKPTPAAADR